MKLTNLETFVWVARLGSFSAAGERLHATQPTISARIASLEQSLGVTFFERSGKSSSLSPRGLQLLPYAEKMLGLANEIELVVGDKEAVSGIVRLGTSETLVHTWLPDLLRRVHGEYPGVTVEILVDLTVNLRERLVSREIDVAFLLGPVSEPNMANTALCAYSMVWVAAPEFALPEGSLSLADLAALPIITFLRPTRPHVFLREALAGPDLPPLRISGSSSLATMIRMVEDGLGVSPLPWEVVRPGVESGQLRRFETALALPDLEFTATYPVSPPNPMIGLIEKMALETVALEIGALETGVSETGTSLR